MRATTNDTPKPQSALLLAVLILALLGAQTYWLYRWHGFNEDLLLANTRRSGENALDSRKITDLNAASVRINGLYLRLQDPLPSSAPNLAAASCFGWQWSSPDGADRHSGFRQGGFSRCAIRGDANGS